MSSAMASSMPGGDGARIFDRLLVPLVSLGVPLLIWEFLARSGLVSDFLFPRPAVFSPRFGRTPEPMSTADSYTAMCTTA